MSKLKLENFKWKWQDTFSVIAGLLSLGYALINYNQLPPQLPAQFGITGEVNTYWDKDSLIAVFGTLAVLWPFLLQFTRIIDPKRENYKKFENAHAMIRLAVALLFDACLVLSVTYGLDKDIPVYNILLAALGLMFIVIGNFMPQLKHNYFLGIRTPWTLASPKVWRKTHRLSGICWAAAGLLFIAGALLPQILSIPVIITGLVAATVPPMFYSWYISNQAGD
ncbi:SdpI family protein [Paenibacillus sp. sgz500958]|uniref:SdpI family protein n=1 Tax=Paenibacillus sp. sgz500958 TaxID=3242475 RepID=UPI0036D28F6E